MTKGAVAGGIPDAVAALPPGRYLLAVSGGRDSMVLLDAFAKGRRAEVCAVATYDHGTGAAATRAAELVVREAGRHGITAIADRWEREPEIEPEHTPAARADKAAAPPPATELAWRRARWRFLRHWARELHATVVTAHTRDDQLETVVMRALRDPLHTSPRGLAAMYAPSATARPLLDITRAQVTAYAMAHDLPFVDDPSNTSRRYLRNRVRLDLLPALERAVPGFGEAMLHSARAAQAWRQDVEAVIDQLPVRTASAARQAPGDTAPDPARRTATVPAAPLADLPTASLAILWPAIAARAGVTLDWRGTERLAAFTTRARPGTYIPLSGGARVHRTATSFVVTAGTGDQTLYL